MARFDRCSICDYSEGSGSSLGNTRPGQNGRVRRDGENYYCDTCANVIVETFSEYFKEDGENDAGP